MNNVTHELLSHEMHDPRVHLDRVYVSHQLCKSATMHTQITDYVSHELDTIRYV